ncbi:MAG: N-6 DNA methylase [Phycisphaerae bacterium]|nr:N-6 DNA methylase [Phycisphaerae bacterium]
MAREALKAVTSDRDVQSLTIVEPAAGSGVIVAALIEAMSRLGPRPRCAPLRALQRIRAIDTDPRVRPAAGQRLRLALGRVPSSWLQTHYRIGDSLLEPLLLPRHPIDLIIGNPPYLGVRHARRLPAFARWRGKFDVSEDLYAFFIRWAMETVRPGGHVVLLVPDTWLSLASYEDLRRRLLQDRLRLIVRLPADTFNRQVFPCFFVWQKAESGAARVRYVDARHGQWAASSNGGRVRHAQRYHVGHSLFTQSPRSIIFVPTKQACETAALWHALDRPGRCDTKSPSQHSGVRVPPVLRHGRPARDPTGETPVPQASSRDAKIPIVSSTVPIVSSTGGVGTLTTLDEIARIADVGIHSRNCRHRLFYARRTRPGLQRLIQGRQIERYAVCWDSPGAQYRWVDVHYVPEPGVRGRRGNGRSSVRDEYWDWQGDPAVHRLPERVLIRQTGDHIVAARCIQKRAVYYTDNTLFTATLTNTAITVGISHAYLLAYLNSAIVTRLYQFLSGERGRAQAQVKIGLLRQLPFVWPSARSIAQTEALVDTVESAAATGKPASTQLHAIDRHFARLFTEAAGGMLH